MHLERNKAGDLSWVTKFVNHTSDVKGKRTIKFTLLTHPSKPKPENFREQAWMYRGAIWADEYFGGDFLKPDEKLIAKARSMARLCSQLDGKNMTEEEILKWRPEGPSFWRYYQNRGIGNVPGKRFDPSGLSKEEQKELKFDELRGRGGAMEGYFPNKIAYFFDRHVEIGRRHGWWWDETWPVYRSARVAEGTAYLRHPADVRENELPYQEGFVSGHMRDAMKRLARIMKKHNIPNRNYYWANNEATCYESFGYDAALVEDCGGTTATFELDMLQVYPNSLYQYEAHNWTGLVTRLTAENSGKFSSGDDERINRQMLGIALLHDIGVSMEGPHGTFLHKEEAIPLLSQLYRFGFFEPDDIEKLPFWRNDRITRFEKSGGRAKRGVLSKLEGDVEITVYRRPLDDGREGYKALIVILNETDDHVQGPLILQNVKRILGGPNTLTAGELRGQIKVPEELESWWNQLAGRNGDAIVLMDVETAEVVAKSGTASEAYGPVYVPHHNYRLLYAEHAE